MKFVHFIAAGLMVAGIGVSTAASAQDYRGDRYERRYDHRGYDRYHGRGHGWDRGRHYGWRDHRRSCRTEWRHHHRVNICYR